jgi:hypothetical protein
VVLHADVDEHHVADDRENRRECDVRVRRELNEGNDAPEVVQEDEAEQRREIGRETDAPRADHVDRDVVAHEAVNALREPLLLGGNELRLPVGHQEEDDDDRDRQPDQCGDLGEPVAVVRAPRQDAGQVEVLDIRRECRCEDD